MCSALEYLKCLASLDTGEGRQLIDHHYEEGHVHSDDFAWAVDTISHDVPAKDLYLIATILMIGNGPVTDRAYGAMIKQMKTSIGYEINYRLAIALYEKFSSMQEVALTFYAAGKDPELSSLAKTCHKNILEKSFKTTV